MKDISEIQVDYTYHPPDKKAPLVPVRSGTVKIRFWESGDPFPDFGYSVGIDTETELITETVHDPPMVVLGAFDPDSMTCWIVYWNHAREFMMELNRREIQQRYFNLGFDEAVIDNEEAEKSLLTAIDVGRVRDMMIRTHIYDVATYGVVMRSKWCNHYSLEGCTWDYFRIKLEKGHDEGDAAARLNFRRSQPITLEQAIYLAYDCMSTWAIGEVIPEQKTEIVHTKGMVVLAHISNNGLQVSEIVFRHIEQELMEEKAKYRLQLMDYGFPDPDKEKVNEIERHRQMFDDLYMELVMRNPECARFVDEGEELPSLTKERMKMMLVFMYVCDMKEDLPVLFQRIIGSRECVKPEIKLDAAQKRVFKDIETKYELMKFTTSRKTLPMLALMTVMLRELVEQPLTNGFDFDSAVEKAGDYLDEHPEWLTKDEIGPQTFLQNHFKSLLEQNPDLVLERTEKSKQIKLSLKDQWRLEDAGVVDPFLNAYTHFKHCQKYLSTYLNREYIKADNRIHARFTNYLRTGRTSCSKPNIQNLPSRDKTYPLKNMFVPYDGMVLCATDFSFVELCAFAQSCYSRFGFSVMRDVINANLDPHRWFAGVMNKTIKPDLDKKDDPDWVAYMTKFLEEHVTKDMRQKAKAANFGFPGALGVKTFYKNCRESGIKLTMQDAAYMHDIWIDTFQEMKYHMNPERMKDEKFVKRFYANRPDDEEDEIEIDPSERSRMMYRAELPIGQVRSYCTYNAACNTQFQALAAIGAKQAGWNLLYAGLGDRLVNFVHDEYLYCLFPYEIKQWVPIIEDLMVQGMKSVIPDVKVGVETSCMKYWDKGAKEFGKLEWDDNGYPILEAPEYVQNILNPQPTE